MPTRRRLRGLGRSNSNKDDGQEGTGKSGALLRAAGYLRWFIEGRVAQRGSATGQSIVVSRFLSVLLFQLTKSINSIRQRTFVNT